MPKNFGIIDSNEYRGLSLEDAKKLAEKNGFITRVSERDGVSLMLTADFSSNRINFRVRDNIITEAYPG